MAQITFHPSNKTIKADSGTTILEAAQKAGIIIESPCNKAGTCGKCKVRLSGESVPNVVSKGRHHLSAKEIKEGYVLSCQTEIKGDITVEILETNNNRTLKILSFGKSFNADIDSHIVKKYVKNLDKTLITAGSEVIGTEEGNTEKCSYGVVVDIGTTTLVTSLVDLISGREIGSVSSLNPQAILAQDVLSRIKFASDENGLETMYGKIIAEIRFMVEQLSSEYGVERKHIYEAVFSGNTCMIHLAAGVTPYSLGQYPYTPKISGGEHLKASDHKIGISDFGLIYIPPVISAYVGADITSGILASQLYDEKEVTLFVDIGTNGEMAVYSEGKIYSTSTAAGPAFEGMNITYGMRAGKGAVELFNIEENGSITINTIGNTKSKGICGSGLLDIVGELVAHGVINQNGKFAAGKELPSYLAERLFLNEGKTVFKITDDIFLSQKDIRQVQLAKGAVRAGIEFLLRGAGVDASQVGKVLIAGSFGYHLRAKSLINIGLLPREFEDRIEFLGNTSKTGGQVFLTNKNYRGFMQDIVKKVQVVELANYKDFDKVFVKALGF